MFTIKYTKSFEKDFKRCKQRGYEMEALNYGDELPRGMYFVKMNGVTRKIVVE